MDDFYEGPIPVMYLFMRPLNRFTSAEQGTMRFTATDFSGDNIIVAGHVLHLRDIRHFVDSLIGETKEQIKTQLFWGLDIADVDWTPGIVHEEPRNVSVAYSCFVILEMTSQNTSTFSCKLYSLTRVSRVASTIATKKAKYVGKLALI